MTYKSRVPSDPAYLLALGQATYSYSYLEWQVIWLAQKLDQGFAISSTNELAGGKIAALFKSTVKSAKTKVSDVTYARLRDGYADLFRLVAIRNDLLHAHPFTATDGQRLGRYKDGKNVEWTIEGIDDACMRFDKLAIELNDIFHKALP
ncbi:hypothetical protein ACIQUG_08325 [Ensifer sp. NPDC090286]|uniref:hypothetical protein n=1 Tax=Ensifer sp. NPDC090286 TaxID=3363991 RepID=UPI00383B9F1D